MSIAASWRTDQCRLRTAIVLAAALTAGAAIVAGTSPGHQRHHSRVVTQPNR